MGALIHFHEGITDRQSTKVRRGIDSRHGKHSETNRVNSLSSAHTMTQQPHP